MYIKNINQVILKNRVVLVVMIASFDDNSSSK